MSDFDITSKAAGPQVLSVALQPSGAQVASIGLPGPKGPRGSYLTADWPLHIGAVDIPEVTAPALLAVTDDAPTRYYGGNLYGPKSDTTPGVNHFGFLMPDGVTVIPLPDDAVGRAEVAEMIAAAIEGTVATYADLPAAAANVGKEIYVTETRCYFRSNGTDWVQTSIGEFTAVEKDALDPADFPSGLLITVTGTGAGIYRNTGSAFSLFANTGSGGSGGQKIYVDIFTSSDNWTKRTGANWVRGRLIAGGGGGGGGCMSNPGTSAFGGGGGGGGSITDFEMSAADLPGTVSVVVAAGGVGGAARTTVANGGDGGLGGDTEFGTFWHAKSGNSGSGGTAAAGTAGVAQAGFPQGSVTISGFYNTGSAGGAGSSAAGWPASAQLFGPQGGGGGGGVNTSGTAQAGGAANARNVNGTSGPYIGYVVVPGGAVNTNGGNGASNPMPSSGNGAQGGSGGGGAPSSGSTRAGNGGNGGFPGGGGGGGGGATTNSTSSGNGGNGGNGLAIIITYCE